jgi:hypothetical protein
MWYSGVLVFWAGAPENAVFGAVVSMCVARSTWLSGFLAQKNGFWGKASLPRGGLGFWGKNEGIFRRTGGGTARTNKPNLGGRGRVRVTHHPPESKRGTDSGFRLCETRLQS